MEEKVMLFGKHVIINDGDFKGVTGIVKTIEIEKHDIIATSGKENTKLICFTYENDVIVKIIVNDLNIITIPLKCISELK